MLASRTLIDANSGAVSHILTGQSEKRVSITFFPPGSGRATLSNETPVTAGSGITLVPGQTYIYLNVHTYGDAVQREWYVIYDGATAPLTWMEALATCEHDQRLHFGRDLTQRNQLYPDMIMR
jgi:hypothetical protein